jgi:hypothetical protein
MEMSNDEIGIVRLQVERHRGQHDASQPAHGENGDESDDEEGWRGEPQASAGDGGDPGEYLDAACNGHAHAGGGKEAERERRQTRRKHMMDPQAEADDAHGDQGQDDEPMTDEPCLRHHRQNHRDHAGRGDEDNVDLGVAEEPEQMLPQQRIAAFFRHEKWPAECTLDLEQNRGENQRRKCEHDHQREN